MAEPAPVPPPTTPKPTTTKPSTTTAKATTTPKSTTTPPKSAPPQTTQQQQQQEPQSPPQQPVQPQSTTQDNNNPQKGITSPPSLTNTPLVTTSQSSDTSGPSNILNVNASSSATELAQRTTKSQDGSSNGPIYPTTASGGSIPVGTYISGVDDATYGNGTPGSKPGHHGNPKNMLPVIIGIVAGIVALILLIGGGICYLRRRRRRQRPMALRLPSEENLSSPRAEQETASTVTYVDTPPLLRAFSPGSETFRRASSNKEESQREGSSNRISQLSLLPPPPYTRT